MQSATAGEQYTGQRYPGSLQAKDAVSQPLIETVTDDISYVVNELYELTAIVRNFADNLVGSRPTPMPGANANSKNDAPPRRGERLVTTVGNLKDAQRDLRDEVSRLSAI